MRHVPSATSPRYLALWFPFLPADRLERIRRRSRQRSPRSGGPDDGPLAPPPLVFVEKVDSALRLAALDRHAVRCGLAPGGTLADARARIPHLAVVDHDPVADAAFLDEVADDCDRWTPLVGLDAPDGLILDITGCAHLFGGEAAMRARLLAHLRRHGLGAFAVVAGTPDAARALARAGKGCIEGGIVAPGGEAQAVAGLPIALLGVEASIVNGLSRAGLKTVGDLAARPGTPLAARFGEDLLVRLRRTLGREDIRIVPRRPLPACIAERRFAEPIGRAGDVEGTLARLVDDVAMMLEARGEGGRVFEASLFRADGAVRRLIVTTGRPTREGTSLSRLWRERIESLADPIDPGFGFDLIRLSVLRAEPLVPAQVGLDGRELAREEVAAMVDRLSVRLGRERVLGCLLRDTHVPDRSSVLIPIPTPLSVCAPQSLPRPLTLFDPPQPVEALAEVPDGPPLRFRWRRAVHMVTRAEGPERIAPEWWRQRIAGPVPPTRDYFRVENRAGRRFWLFRAGLYGRETAEPRWFIHGLFP